MNKVVPASCCRAGVEADDREPKRTAKIPLMDLTSRGTSFRSKRRCTRGKVGLFTSELRWSERWRVDIQRLLGLTVVIQLVSCVTRNLYCVEENSSALEALVEHET